MPSNQRFRKSNNPTDDPNFNLDDYLEEKGYETDDSRDFEDEIEKADRRYTNVLIVAVAVTGMFWYMDFTPRAIYQSLFGSPNVETVSGTPVVVDIPPINIEIPEINIPDIDIDIDPDVNSNEASLGPILEYLQELQNQGLLDTKISAFEARQVYYAGVPINYLLELDQKGYLEEFSFVEIGEFYKNQIPFEYLDEMDQNGYLDRLSFVEIGEFYKSQIPFEYLDELDESGYLDRLSFVEIGEFYKNDVSFDYLDKLDQTGYLDELSFVYVVEYYRNGVTTEFLDELKETGLYNSLSFIDVVELYKNQN
jgi:hypothetical protein